MPGVPGGLSEALELGFTAVSAPKLGSSSLSKKDFHNDAIQVSSCNS